MAIEGVKNNVISQITRTEKPAVSMPEEASVSVKSTAQEFMPVTAVQSGSGQGGIQNNGKEQEAQDIQDVSPEKVKSALADINKKIRPTNTRCEFKYHEETHRISITVRDRETDKVIKEIPPEKMLDMVAKTLELAGLLVDEKR